jgi:hypothetical protein
MVGGVMLAVILLGLACSGDSKDGIDSGAGFDGPGESATMEGCTDWLAQRHDPSLPMACSGREGELDWRAEMLAAGATIFPIGDQRYGLIWLPDEWTPGDPLLYIIHNSDGCPEQFVTLWDNVRESQGYGFVAVSYREPGSSTYDDEPVIYDNLSAIHGELVDNCPVKSSAKAYYGFSRGAGRAYGVSFLDRAASQPFLDGYIIDSGTTRINPVSAEDGILDGARYWLWCGGRDPDPVNKGALVCDTMRDDHIPTLQSFGGETTLIEDTQGCHGMFFSCEETCDDCRLRKDSSEGDFPKVFDFLQSL